MQANATEMVAIDFETTGAIGGFPSEPWQVGMVVFKAGQVQPSHCFDHLIRVGDRPFNPNAPGEHQRLRAQIACAPTLQELWPELQRWWQGRPLIAHNTSTEQNILLKQAPFHRFGPWIDTLKLMRLAYPDLPGYDLQELIKRSHLEARLNALLPQRAPHDALYDAVACALLLEHLLQHPGWNQASVDALAQAHPHEYHQRQARQRSRRLNRPR